MGFDRIFTLNLCQGHSRVAHCCTIFLKSSGYRNIDDRHRNVDRSTTKSCFICRSEIENTVSAINVFEFNRAEIMRVNCPCPWVALTACVCSLIRRMSF